MGHKHSYPFPASGHPWVQDFPRQTIHLDYQYSAKEVTSDLPLVLDSILISYWEISYEHLKSSFR